MIAESEKGEMKMQTVIEKAQNPRILNKVRDVLSAGKLAEMLKAQGGAERGGEMQLLTMLAAEQIIAVELNWRWGATEYDSLVNEFKGKYEHYGARLFPLTEAQRNWASSFLSEQYRRAKAAADEPGRKPY